VALAIRRRTNSAGEITGQGQEQMRNELVGVHGNYEA
jgi:hypothetical protein